MEAESRGTGLQWSSLFSETGPSGILIQDILYTVAESRGTGLQWSSLFSETCPSGILIQDILLL